MNTWQQSSECPVHQAPADLLAECLSMMRYPFSPHLIRSSHKTKALHCSYRKAMNAWVARWSCFQSQTKEQLTSKPDFILASLLSSVHFRCWDLWQVHMPHLTTDPYSIEGQMLLLRRSINCYSLLCVSNPIRAPSFALSPLLLHAAMCLNAYAPLAETLWIFSRHGLGGITVCRNLLQFLLMSSHDSGISSQKYKRTNVVSPNHTS